MAPRSGLRNAAPLSWQTGGTIENGSRCRILRTVPIDGLLFVWLAASPPCGFTAGPCGTRLHVISSRDDKETITRLISGNFPRFQNPDLHGCESWCRGEEDDWKLRRIPSPPLPVSWRAAVVSCFHVNELNWSVPSRKQIKSSCPPFLCLN